MAGRDHLSDQAIRTVLKAAEASGRAQTLSADAFDHARKELATSSRTFRCAPHGASKRSEITQTPGLHMPKVSVDPLRHHEGTLR